MKKLFAFLAVVVIVTGCFAGCSKTVGASEKDNSVAKTTEESEKAVTSTVDEEIYGKETTSLTVSSSESKSESTKSDTVQRETQVQTTKSTTTLVDTFVITKVSGTYLELYKADDEKNDDKQEYCCDLGELDGSADMHYKVGDTITLCYDAQVAETYPLQLTVLDIQ